MHLGVIGLYLQRAAVVLHRIIELFVSEQRIADVVIGSSIIRFMFDRGVKGIESAF